MSTEYDIKIDLSSNDGGVPRGEISPDKWITKVRLYGNSVERKVQVPMISGILLFVNDGGEDVKIFHGAALPVVIGRGEASILWFDGTTNGMYRLVG
jgi:hypothetical protein